MPVAAPPSLPGATGSVEGKWRSSNEEHGMSSARDRAVSCTSFICVFPCACLQELLGNGNLEICFLNDSFQGCLGEGSRACRGRGAETSPSSGLSSSRFGAVELPAHLVAIGTSRSEHHSCQPHRCAPSPRCNSHLYLSRIDVSPPRQRTTFQGGKRERQEHFYGCGGFCQHVLES